MTRTRRSWRFSLGCPDIHTIGLPGLQNIPTQLNSTYHTVHTAEGYLNAC